MPDLHTRAVSSTDQLDLRPAIRDAINGSIAKILQIRDDAGPLSPERFERVERQILEACMDLGRCVLQGILEDRDAQLPDAIEQDGRVLRRRKATPKTIATLLGNVTYKRSRYRTREAGASLVPVDESLGLIKGRPARPMARVCVLLLSHGPARDAHEILAGIGTASPSVSTLQRVTRSMNADLEKLPSEQRTRIRSGADIPAGARSVSVSLDGVMMPLMKGEDGRSEGSWREASCGAVSFQDAQGNRQKTLYFGRMPEAGKETLKAEIEREVARIRELAEARLPVLAVADAAPDNWRFLDGLKPDAVAVDFWHACQHLSVVAAHARSPGAWFRSWRRALRDDPDGADRVVRAIRYLRHKARTRTARKELDRELAFFRKNRRRMRYAELADKAMGIGSGVVEAANKVLVAQRMKRSGMRWRIRSGQAVLSFRALQKSGLFDRTWSDLMAARDAASNENHPLPECALAA